MTVLHRRQRLIGAAAVLSLLLGLGALAGASTAAAATKQVEITASLKFIATNDGPYKCAARVYVQFPAWDTESYWEIHYTQNGSPRTTSASPSSSKLDPSYASPPAGYHWFLIASSSKDASGPELPRNCEDFSNNQKGVYANPEVYVTVNSNDPGPEEEEDPPTDPSKPKPPKRDDLTPSKEIPPPPTWPFDARRPTITLVDCVAQKNKSKPMRCTAAVWDARPEDASASAPVGRVGWFSAIGKLRATSCKLVRTTGPVSTCTVLYKPSAKTARKAWQPVEGGYRGSKKHSPSSGRDGAGPTPIPVKWAANNQKATVTLYCGGDRVCRGTAILRGKKGRKFVQVGQRAYEIRPGKTKAVVVNLNKTGRMLARRSAKRFQGRLVIVPKVSRAKGIVYPVKI